MEKLFILLELQRRAQEAVSRQAFAHIAVNETHKLVPYQQAVFWSYDGATVKLDKVSGNAVLDPTAPYAVKLTERLQSLIAHKKSVQSLTYPDEGRHVAALQFRTVEEGLLGGLWLENTEPFAEAHLQLLEELGLAYAHELALLTLRQKKSGVAFFKTNRRLRQLAVAAVAVLTLLPVHLSVTAPAEIVAKDADIITVPYDGMIATVHVEPGDKVAKGQVLVSMENAALTAQMDVAGQDLKMTESSMARLARESLATPAKKSDLTAAEAEIDAKKLQYSYAQDLQERSEIRAPRDGIAVFSDAHLLQGRPMNTGEKIMMVADTASYDVLVRVPAEAMIPLSDKRLLSFYLNVAPLSGYDAQITSIGYQASPDPDGLLTYKIHARPLAATGLRIGWKGTAQVKGGWTVLSYSIMRRPLAALRRLSGI